MIDFSDFSGGVFEMNDYLLNLYKHNDDFVSYEFNVTKPMKGSNEYLDKAWYRIIGTNELKNELKTALINKFGKSAKVRIHHDLHFTLTDR